MGQRKYKIDLREDEEFEVIDNVSERQEVETEEEVRSEDKQVYLLDDDEENFYGHHSG